MTTPNSSLNAGRDKVVSPLPNASAPTNMHILNPSDGEVLTYVAATGLWTNLPDTDSAGVTPPVTITGTDNSTIPLKVVGAASQGVPIFEVVSNDAVTVLSFSDPQGLVVEGIGTTISPSIDSTNKMLSWATFNGNHAVGLSHLGAMTLETDPAATVDPMVINIPGGGSAIARVTSTGAVITASHAAPSDGSLNAGDMAIWFDQTNGAGKLMIKAKTANGTVATGSVTLT